MKHLKYPRTPAHIDRRRKISDIQRSQIVEMRRGGYSLRSIAEAFKISLSLANYWTSPKHRKRQNELRKHYHVDMKRHKKNMARWYQRKKLEPGFREYATEVQKRWVAKNRKRWNKYCRELRKNKKNGKK